MTSVASVRRPGQSDRCQAPDAGDQDQDAACRGREEAESEATEEDEGGQGEGLPPVTDQGAG